MTSGPPTSDWRDQLTALVLERRGGVPDRPLVIGLAGGVASGKSTLAALISEHLREAGLSVRVVATDGFLLSNARLERQGLMERKGFPETYDMARLGRFLDRVAAGARRLSVPTYSHAEYDVGPVERFSRPDVVILEGLIALRPEIRPLDMALYVDATEAQQYGWYLERFLRLLRWKSPRLAAILKDSGGTPESLARDVWDRINGPNLRDHVAPTRGRAEWILRKADDHTVTLVSP